ncbi:conserved hypothetical protein [Bradyrhizobium sp. STM 3843]|uniref:hypothetical protein n=1 Tax=Bradyrhizobium sp. STM 3843 TaxID=551947 RepID=UPI0002404D43|nr:hypothetical protein [Bradyrhizobium sp. STM 3843]CCE11737.1 conserved hypothetical protein [Bradyrhizobium sp. STM 3843]
MAPVTSQLQTAAFERLGGGGASAGLRDLFALLGDLLIDGGDLRLALDRPWGHNAYGCSPTPSPEILNFASSTASPISERAYARAELAREQLMHVAIHHGVGEALDRRTEEMRSELKTLLGLDADIGVVFSPSGTDSQLHALGLARARLGDALTTIVVGSDQTGSGTEATARGRHFGATTAHGASVQKGQPVEGLAGDSIGVPLLDCATLEPRDDCGSALIGAVETAIASGHAVMLQVMDASKLGWRAPDRACLDEIARRWPGQVQIVVDACQMRLSRRRISDCLDRGHLVLVTGSKFFGGPAFSGAVLVPPQLAKSVERGAALAAGLSDYVSRSDWPMNWTALRAASPARANIGQWLRWEAALAEIAAYYQVPDRYRRKVLCEFGGVTESLLMLSPALRPLATAAASADADDDEFGFPTIFPFALQRDGRLLGAGEVQLIYRALQRDLGARFSGGAAEVAARQCLIGQPVRIDAPGSGPTALLRLCLGARQVIETWSDDLTTTRVNIDAEIGRIADVIAKIELLVADVGSRDLRDMCDGI